MPPFRVEYQCIYRPQVWRWDGQESMNFLEAIQIAGAIAATGRTVRILDDQDLIVWPPEI